MAIKDRLSTTPTTTMKFTDARAHLSEIFNRVAKEETRILVEKNGVPVGAIISARDLQRFEAIEAEAHARAYAAFAAFGDAFKDVSDEEFERELAKAQVEARRKIQAECDRADQG
jgi:prevent-host-death family protein